MVFTPLRGYKRYLSVLEPISFICVNNEKPHLSNIICLSIYLCERLELNQRHTDFQSVATTRLSYVRIISLFQRTKKKPINFSTGFWLLWLVWLNSNISHTHNPFACRLHYLNEVYKIDNINMFMSTYHFTKCFVINSYYFNKLLQI